MSDMSYFPMYINIKNEDRVLLIGGGNVALQKLKVLKKNDIKVHLVAKQVDLSIYDYLSEYAERLFCDQMPSKRLFRFGDRCRLYAGSACGKRA